MKFNITLQDLQALNPCFDPATKLGTNWSGTLIDILDFKDATDADKIWAVTKLLDDKTARLFAVHCAREALKGIPIDKIHKDTLEVLVVAERFANGQATKEELSAARSAAWSAAESAAWSAAWSAAESAARSAAWSAAESAARSAAWSAAESAARSAARSAAWSAAWSAARSAAWSAAESAAWSAARSAAWSAAESAARSAARSAAWSAQLKKLREMILELNTPKVDKTNTKSLEERTSEQLLKLIKNSKEAKKILIDRIEKDNV